MKAFEIMTREVLGVSPDTRLIDAVETMTKHGISGLPVMSKGRLVGIVTEHDILCRLHPGEVTSSTGLPKSNAVSDEHVKAHANKVRDAMTYPVVTVLVETSINDIAGVLEAHRIKRVPVMDGDRLVGIVSRGDLIKALARYVPIWSKLA